MSTQFRGSDGLGRDARQPFPATSGLAATLFPPTSRYHGLSTLSHRGEDGREIAYLERRFVPLPENFEELRQHVVSQGDRPDNLAYTYLGDATQYWRLCDANGVLDPDELTDTAGRRIRITLPEGIPGAPRA